jgi:hypothetical protein
MTPTPDVPLGLKTGQQPTDPVSEGMLSGYPHAIHNGILDLSKHDIHNIERALRHYVHLEPLLHPC